jgi:hypothetical protein
MYGFILLYALEKKLMSSGTIRDYDAFFTQTLKLYDPCLKEIQTHLEQQASLLSSIEVSKCP